jgi:hypothetical protein
MQAHEWEMTKECVPCVREERAHLEKRKGESE